MSRSPRSLRLVAAIATVGVLLAVALAGRRPILRAAGWVLVADDPIRAADWIVIAVDAGDAGVLEAADLVHEGIARRVAILGDHPTTVDREFLRRGMPHETAVPRAVRQLKFLGVTHVEEIPRPVGGTEDEGRVLPEWCDQRQLESIVVVSSSDHTRRLRRTLHRAMSGRRTHVTVRSARYSDFDPEHWWETRGGIRTGIVEVEKLFLDFVRHPIS